MENELHIETFTTDWQGIALSVTFEARWLNSESANIAHLQVKSVGRIPLPITETGYRSHFLPADEVAAAGGAVAYVLAWLNHAATAPEWRARPEAMGQLSLF
ncbi:MAG: hypothetical protein Q7U20_07735 [Caulobacter sp.]|nr:hypothetical protein [Caulobacter sp.]